MLNFLRKNLTLSVVTAAGLTALAGCGGDAVPGSSGGPTGQSVGSLALVVNGVPPLTFNSFAYSITGPSTKSGSLDVSNASTISALIGGVAVGTGYGLTLSGTSTDGQTSCTGTSAAFNVAGGATTSVAVAIDCHRPRTTGSVLDQRHHQHLPDDRRRSARTRRTGNIIAHVQQRQRSGRRAAAAHLQPGRRPPAR